MKIQDLNIRPRSRVFNIEFFQKQTQELQLSSQVNPFHNNAEKSQIWNMLVKRDIVAFVTQDWNMVACDFIQEGFLGIDAKGSNNPDDWAINFPTLAIYRDEWLRQAAESAKTEYTEDRTDGIFRATTLEQIDINGNSAVAHKKFDGSIQRTDGGTDILHWQTLYFCRKEDSIWKITGFVGYLPLDMGGSALSD